MIIRMCAFTGKGMEIVKKIEDLMPKHLVEIREPSCDLQEWTRECFRMKVPIVFVGAAGIAVRTIAPFVKDKLEDSPVMVVDEGGRFVVPVLSGHMGGANALANEIARVLHATAVITTATDINGLFSVDVFALKNGLKILNRSGIREVSSGLLQKKEITMALGEGITANEKDLPEEVRLVAADGSEQIDVYITDSNECAPNALLTLSARPYVLGVGCKKGIAWEAISEAVTGVLNQADILLDDVSQAASIDLKERERGLLVFSSMNHIPFLTFSAEELEAVKGEFSQSEFVRSVTGVSNICERAAVAAAGADAKLVVSKQAGNGVTVAVAKRKVILHA